MKYDDAIRLQKKVAEKIVSEDDFGLIDRDYEVNIAYSGDVECRSAGVMERDWELVDVN